MTARGPPARPTIPEDPNLEPRSVSHKRSFPVRSFRPGAAFESFVDLLDEMARQAYLEELGRAARPSEGTGIERDAHENGSLLHAIENDEAVERGDDDMVVLQPTWVYYIFLIDYKKSTMEALASALANWLLTIKFMQGAASKPGEPVDVCGAEVYRGLKLEVIINEDALKDASSDRVREYFKAQIRSLEITETTDSDGREWWIGPAGTKFGILLDAAAAHMLADLTFPAERTHSQ
jgi:hypothetical protein